MKALCTLVQQVSNIPSAAPNEALSMSPRNRARKVRDIRNVSACAPMVVCKVQTLVRGLVMLR
jgi:hypothetical protein